MTIVGRICFILLALYGTIAATVFCVEDLMDYRNTVIEVHQPPSIQAPIWFWLGSDGLGRSVLKKILIAVKNSVGFGLIVALGCVLLGIFFGVVSGYFGGISDLFITWLYTTLSAVPGILMLLAIMFMFGNNFWTAVAALVFLDWVGLCRMLRGEVMREKARDYVLAARSIGVGQIRIILRHLIPNLSHYIWIYFALYFIFAVKAEIILAYLGFQFTEGVSWGIIIDEARGELLKGVWWPLTFATITMGGLLLSLQVGADLLRDRFDPKMNTKG